VAVVPRRPDALCAGGCGKLLWNSRTSLPAGERTCLQCRREARPQPRARLGPRVWRIAKCPMCGDVFETDVPSKRFCSVPCRRRCTVPTPELRAQWRERNRKRSAEGVRRTGRPWLRLRRQVLAEESSCWICGDELDLEVRYPHPQSPSVDHVVPLASGGALLERTNCRAAHLLCNVSRGAEVRHGR
jgi:hypothetical protein